MIRMNRPVQWKRILSAALFPLLVASVARIAEANSKRPSILLRPREIRALKPGQKTRYYRELHKILVTLEARQKAKRGARKKSTAMLFLESALAQKDEGSACLMGGYFGRWTTVNGRGECANPEPSQIWESDAGEFECGTSPSGEKRAYCNSAFFLYANDSQERICEPVTNLAANCAKKFEERYMGPASTNRLVADTAKLMEKMGPEEIEEYHRDLDSYLGDMIAGEDDPQTARILKKQIEVLNGLKSVAQKAAPAASSPLTETTAAPKPPVGDKSKLLGEELSCIQNGLLSVGIHPSERYLALLGAGIQAYRGPFKTNDPESLKQFRAAVISTVQAFGVCSDSVYTASQDSRDVSRIRSLLTAGNGQVTATGWDYFGTALGVEKKDRTEVLFDLFGLRGTTRAPFDFRSTDEVERGFKNLFPDATTWQTKNLVERQRTLSNWSGYGDRFNKTPFERCRADALNEMKEDGKAFNIEALNRDNRRAAVKNAASNDQALQKLYRVSEENLRVCTAMASACGLEANPVCEARNLVRPPTAAAPSQAPPAPGPPPAGVSK